MKPVFSLLSTHGLALAAIARAGPTLTLREVGDFIGVKERAAFQIVTELQQSGFLVIHKVGRRNLYEVVPDAPLAHPMLGDLTLADLLGTIFRQGIDRPVGSRPAGLEGRALDSA